MNLSRAGAPSRAAVRLLELGLLLVTPLAFYRGFPEQFTYLKLVLTEGIVLAGATGWALALIWGSARRPVKSRLAAPLALFTMAVLISCLLSPLPAFSLAEAGSFLCGPLWLLLMLSWGRGEARVRWLAGLVTIAGAAVAAVALLQWAGRDPLVFGGYRVEWGTMRAALRLYSTFGNPNFVAGYLIGAVFLALALAGTAGGFATRILSGTAALAMFAAIIGTRSRGAWVGLIAGLLVARDFWKKAPGGDAPATVPPPGAGTICAGLLPAGLIFWLPNLAQQAQSLLVHLEGRWGLARASWPMFAEHPLFGGGWGLFQLRHLELQAQFLHAHPEYVRHWTHLRQLHNDPLQVLLEAGALGLVAFGWLLWRYGSEVRSVSPPMPRSARLWAGASAGGVTALLVDSLLNFQLAVPPTLILLFTVLAFPALLGPGGGAAESPAADVRRPKRKAAAPALASVVILGLAGMLAWGIVQRARAEHRLARGLDAERQGAYDRAEREFRAGLGLQPGDGRLHYGLARALYLQDAYPEALAEALRAERTAADSHLEVLKARILDQMGFEVAALQAYRHALWLNPTLKSVPADIERLEKQGSPRPGLVGMGEAPAARCYDCRLMFGPFSLSITA